MNKAPIIETGLSSLNAVEDTISQRRSLRGFLDKPVDREIIERILFLAGRAPSGTNMQPWRGHVMTCLLYTSPSPRDFEASRMPSSA